ncbi:DUF389 domain-containing protein [Natrinema sp. 1APR25-10V2]|uniref:DUF389 domain-containing protein n=1 Tax=Natrinema sp. 1APR25-10V2 TaxID=2951081 RepID=UPI0028755B04|nr:DUF389 domain-containing protein [Natrinema sp. 1APR25-10V2]MDS0473416.1 DUF389 domain-containing protein [Natrinema sp. 1APR25-10V2]
MRLIQIFVPSDVRPSVGDTLDGMDVEYLFVDEDGTRDGAVAYVPVPAGAVDTVLERLYDAGLDEDTYTVVTDVQRATIPNVDELTDEYVDGPKGARGASHPEIRDRARDLTPETATYIAFAALSAIVAVGGLLLNSAIVIVGAMVIAPFAGSTLSASVGAVISDREMVVDSATSQIVGLVVAFVGAVAMSLVLQRTGFMPPSLVVSRIDQVSSFLTPNLLTLVIAIAAGFAGALALATDLPVSLAGVAVAAAIVPAAATAGIGVVWGQPIIALGAIVLLLMNIVFINLAAYAALFSLGYRSSVIRNLRNDVSVSVRTGAYAVIVVAFAVVVALTAVGTYSHLAFEQDVNQGVETVMDDPTYGSLELVSVATDYNDMNVLGNEETVTVTVSRSTDAEYAQFADELQREIAGQSDRPVTVNVRFIDIEQEQATVSADDPPSRLSRFADRITRAVGASSVRAFGVSC